MTRPALALMAAAVLGGALASDGQDSRRIARQPEARRLALVIGNDAYRSVPPLHNAGADAKTVGSELQRIGFEVTSLQNLDRRGMNRVIADFVAQVGPGAITVFFYAGHAVQIRGSNYLLPVDVAAERETDLVDDAIELSETLARVTGAEAAFSLAIIDACRTNPFRGTGRALGGTRGLAAPTATPKGFIVVYSAGVDEEALDRVGPNDRSPNGLFTRELLPLLATPGLSVSDTVRRLKGAVRERAKSVGHEQNPAIYDQSTDDFYLVPPAGAAASIPPPAVPPPPPPAAATPPVADARFQAALDAAVPLGGVPLRMTALTLEATTAGKVRVTLAVDVDVRKLGFRTESDRSVDTLEFLLISVSAATGEVTRYDQKVEMRIRPATREKLARTWFTILRDFELPPGPQQAKVVVRDRNTGEIGTATHDFDVPPASGFRLGTPVLADALAEGSDTTAPKITATARRHFAPRATLYAQYEVFGAARGPDGRPRVSAGYVLREPGGRTLVQGSPTVIAPTSAGAVRRMIGIPLGDAGGYELVLSLRDEISGRTLQQVLPFVVDPGA